MSIRGAENDKMWFYMAVMCQTISWLRSVTSWTLVVNVRLVFLN